jgi:hypothetical protein
MATAAWKLPNRRLTVFFRRTQSSCGPAIDGRRVTVLIDELPRVDTAFSSRTSATSEIGTPSPSTTPGGELRSTSPTSCICKAPIENWRVGRLLSPYKIAWPPPARIHAGFVRDIIGLAASCFDKGHLSAPSRSASRVPAGLPTLNIRRDRTHRLLRPWAPSAARQISKR